MHDLPKTGLTRCIVSFLHKLVKELNIGDHINPKKTNNGESSGSEDPQIKIDRRVLKYITNMPDLFDMYCTPLSCPLCTSKHMNGMVYVHTRCKAIKSSIKLH